MILIDAEDSYITITDCKWALETEPTIIANNSKVVIDGKTVCVPDTNGQ